MSVKCSAKQIADFITFWGMTKKFPEYCEYAEDVRNLKSLDLIISTLDIFVEAFSSNFKNIYHRYKVNFPLSEEKFIEFLKPRCLLLTKDKKCFNFMLVCAFVYDVIHSFFHYNKCFHLIKVASKCLAAILKRFKEIFETDSGWEKLMSFCLKIHDLVYPSEKICESDGDHFPSVMTDNMDASFPNISKGLEELSIENYAISDNDDESDIKMPGKETSAPLTNDSTTETEGREMTDLNSLKSPTSMDSPRTLQFTGESSLKPEKIQDENKSKDDNDENFINSSLPALSVTSVVTEELDQVICLKRNLTLSFEDYLAIKKVTERLDFRNLGSTSTDPPHTLHLKIEDFSPKRAEIKGKIFDEYDAKKDNEKDSTRDIKSLPESVKEIADIYNEKTTININKGDNEKLDQITSFKENFTLSFDDYLVMKKVIERLEDLCNLGLSSTDATLVLQLKIENLSPKEGKTFEGGDVGKDNEDCVMNMIDSSLPELTKEFTDKVSGKTAIENNKKPNESTGFQKYLSLSFENYLAIKKVIERLERLCNLGLHSDSSPKEEKIYTENDRKKDNEDCVRDIVDLSVNDLAGDITYTTVNNEDGDTEKLGQMIGFQENLIISLGKELAVKKAPESLHLYNLEHDSSTDVLHTFQLKSEDLYPNPELEDKEKGVEENNAKDNNMEVINSIVPDLAYELTKISIEKRSTKKNVKQKSGEIIGCSKKLTLPFSEDSRAQNATEKLADLLNLESGSSSDEHTQHRLKDKEFSSKNESKDNKEPFNISFISADKIRARITENPWHLSEIMDLLKKCEEDIEPNIFSADEYDIPIDDSDEDEELEASGGTSENSTIGYQTIFESNIKTKVFAQNLKMAHSIRRIFIEDNQSDDETLPKATGGVCQHEMSDEYSNQIFESEDPRCSLCADDGMVNFFDTYFLDLIQKYSNNNNVTDLFRFDFNEDSE